MEKVNYYSEKKYFFRCPDCGEYSEFDNPHRIGEGFEVECKKCKKHFGLNEEILAEY